MNIVRKIHDQFRVKTVAGAQLETPEAVSSQGAGGSTFITITGGGGTSLNGSGLSEEDRVKLDSIEQGAQVNQDAFSKIQFDATSIDGNNQSSSSNSSIIANVPTDTANIKIVGNYPITVNLESVSLFNSNTSTTTGTAITTYNISFNSSNNIVIEYVDGTLLNVADVELIQVKHKEDVLATYQLSDITYTTSEGTITSFTIPYSNADFSEIEFCKYETVTTETEEGSTTVRELRVLSTLPASPTKQSIITLNSLTDSFWNYEEDENGNKFVWTDYNVYSTKDVSAYGRGAGTGGSSASNLYELNDVVLTNLSNNDLLIYNSSTSKWVNINKDQLGISADQLHTLTISVNGETQATYNPASADASVNISTITLNEVTEYIDQKIDTKLDASEFFKWFTINYDSSNNIVSIQANFDFYSIGGVSAYGLGEGEAEPSYVSELGQLSDVTLTNVALNNILLYDGNKWVNKPMSSIVVDAYTKSEIDTKLSPITSDISTINATISDIQTALPGKLDKDDFFTWFTIIKNTSGEVVSIQANFDFYSIGEVSAYGLGDIGGSSRTTLATLDDVSLSNLITNDMLVYNGSKWVNIPMSQVRGATSWSDLENKPTTISGFGITDAYTKSEVNTKISEVSSKVTELSSSKADATIQVIAGDGLTGGGNLQQDITIALQNLNSTGTYYKVNVDTYGRVTSGISQLTIADIQNLQTQLDSKLNIADFNTWFTIIYNTDGTIKNIRANYDFYSVGEVSAYGIGDEEKKTYTTLAELNDVQLTNVKETDVLVYNGTKWVNVDQSTIKGAQSWADIQNKPTTIAGFGIVDAYTKTEIDNKLSPINSSITSINSSINTINTNISDLSSSLSNVSTKLNNFLEGSDTDTIINKWKELEAFLAGYTQTQTLADLLSVKANSSIQIIAGTGLVGGGDLTANRTISLSTSGVSAGTYTKVTVDTYGRVTSGSTLSATDIPNLDWSKITSGKPTTLEGYGITDGVNSIVLNGDGNAITEASINNHVLTLVKGATYLQQSTFDDMFEKVNIGTESAPKYAIKAKYGFYSVGEIAAYGLNDDGKTTYTTLAELDDVSISNLAIDNLLKYDGTKWVNVPMSQMVVDAYTKSEMDNKLATLADIVEDVQRQTNRQVAFWFFEYDPTTTNYPASEWTTNEEKLKHEEDMFYNSTNGKVWRWKLNSSSQYEWSLITDADTLRALELVEIAQNTANQKKRNFITTPTKDDAYDVGDLWSNATYGTSYDNDLLVCITAKTAGTNFSISHWQPIGKVTSSYVSGQISIINNSINGLDTRVGTAETNISTAQSTANAAKTAAATAQSTADAAQSAANTAQSTADTAKTNAATAHTAANTAQSTADSAKSTANSALTKATTNESTLTTITSEAPSNLNTFKKLAAAINNDANYYNTVNNKITTEASTLNNKIDTKVSDLNSRIDTEVSTLNNKITSEVSTLNSKINAEVKKLQDQLDTIFSWFAFENDCIKAKYSLFSVGEITAHKTS